MDSEDERRFERRTQKRKKYRRDGLGEAFFSGISTGFPELRLYSMEEYRMLSEVDEPIWARGISGNYYDVDVRQRRRYYRQGVPYHVMRLFDTVKGFHEGSLDLSGRHATRYHSALERWLAFYAQLKGLSDNMDSASEIDEELDETSLRHRAFERRWELKLDYPDLLLRLADIAEDVLRCIARRPSPIFQKIRLLDLPSELLYKIMDSAWPYDARRIGATCKLMRAISLPYIYADRWFTMRGEEDIDWRYTSKLEEEEKRRYFRGKAILARDASVRDASYLCSRPDIAARVKDLAVNCWRDINVETAYPGCHKAALEFRFTFSRAFETIIPLMRNLAKLRLYNVAITSAVATNLVHLPQLETVIFHNCKVTSKLRRVRACSTSVKALFSYFDYHRVDHSIWKLARFFPNLSAIIVCGQSETLSYDEAPPNLLPFNHVPETVNPFLLPTMTHLQLKSLALEEWNHLLTLLEEASMHGTRPLPLTHLSINAHDPLDETFIFELIDALRPAPLRQLVLDGINYADLDLFHSIRIVFPGLTSLTLKHRGGTRGGARSSSASWPRATWEYAHAVSLFPSLTHFGWNYHLEQLIYSRSLLMLEGGYDRDDEGFYWCDDEDDDEDILVSLFANACPNLQTFTTSSLSIYRFQRDGDSVTVDHRMGRKSAEELDSHDPPTLSVYHPWLK